MLSFFDKACGFLTRNTNGSTLYEGQPVLRSFGASCIKIYAMHTIASYLNKVMNKNERQTTRTVKKLWSTQLTFGCEPYQTVAFSLERQCPMPIFHV